MINITKQPTSEFSPVAADMEEQVMSLAIGREVLCPNCSHRRAHQKKTSFKVWANANSRGFSCQNCQIEGFVLSGDQVATPTLKRYEAVTVDTDLPNEIVNYFRDVRGLPLETLVRFKIGHKDGAISIPYYDEGGKQVGVKYRNLAPPGPKDRKMWKETGSKSYFYGIQAMPPEAHKSSLALVLTEGEIDTMTVAFAGIHSALSLPDGVVKDAAQGKKIDVPMKYCADLISRYDSFILALDGDAASKAAVNEWADRLGRHRCRIVKYPEGCKDMNQVLVKYDKQKVYDVIMNAELPPMEGVMEFSEERDLMLQVRKKGFPVVQGIGFGTPFDTMIRFIKAQMNLFTGIPNHGKTHFVLQVMLRLSITRGWKWAIFTPEQDSPSKINSQEVPRKMFLMQSLVEALVGAPMWDDKIYIDDRGNMATVTKMSDEKFLQGFDWINDHFKIIDAGDTNTLVKILEKVDYLKIKYGIDGFLIDPWNKISGSLGLDNADLAKTLIKLDNFCKSREQCMMLCAHPIKMSSRESEKHGKIVSIPDVPTAGSIKGGGEFYDMIANIFTVYREVGEYVSTIYSWKVKHRMLGLPGQQVKFRFNQINGRYEDPSTKTGFDPWVNLEIYSLPMPF